MWHRVKNLLFLMTSYRLPHYGSRSFTFASDDALLSGVILNGARILCEKAGKRSCDTEWKIYHFNDVLWSSLPWEQTLHIRFGWRLTVYCRSARGKNTLWKDRKRNSDTKWRIYYADGVTDSLPLVLLFVFLHIVFDRSYSVWRVLLYNRVLVIFMCIYNFSKIREE